MNELVQASLTLTHHGKSHTNLETSLEGTRYEVKAWGGIAHRNCRHDAVPNGDIIRPHRNRLEARPIGQYCRASRTAQLRTV